MLVYSAIGDLFLLSSKADAAVIYLLAGSGGSIHGKRRYTIKKRHEKMAFSCYVLWICSHVYAMRQRKVLNDIEWTGWLQWMRNCFRKGTMGETWKQVEPDRWFDPAFQNFVKTELIARR